MTRAGAQVLWSWWRRNPLQLITLLAGLALATALWSGVQAINAEARASYDAAAATLGEGRYDQLVPRTGDTLAQADYVALRRAGWQVSPVLEGRIEAGQQRLRLVGLDPLTAPGGLEPLDPQADAGLGAVLGGSVVFAAPETAALLGTSLSVRVVVSADVAPRTVLADIGLAQRLLARPGTLSRLIVADEQPLGRPLLAGAAPNLRLVPAQEGADMGRLTDSFHLNLTAFGLLSFAVGIFIVHGAIGLAFEQRRGLLRTLRALGFSLRRLIWLMLAELLVLALLAGALGVLLGYLVAAALLPDVAATLSGLYGATVSGSLGLRPAWWLSGLAIAVLGTGLAGAGALWQMARLPLLAGAQPRAWAMGAGRGRRWQAAGALLLLGCAGALVVWGHGLLAGFAALASLLIGAALALPPVLAGALRLAARGARGPVAQWFWADTRQQLPGLSLALMALLLAMAANVGVSTMVSSFRLTFAAFLDQRLAFELYVSAETPQEAAALQDFAEPRARAVLPLLSVERTLAGRPGRLYGLRDAATYRDNWGFLAAGPQVWDRLALGQVAIVNEQLARRAGLWLGDTITVGGGRRLPIAGIVGDYGNPLGQVIVGEALFRQLHPDLRATRFGLRSDDPAGLRRALVDDFGLPEGAVTDQAQLKAFSMRVFERTFAVTGALNVLTLAVAGFALLMSLLTLAGMRLPQLAPVWALGLSRRALARLDLARAMVLAVLTTLCALPLGLGLAWVLLAVVNVEAFGWRLPMYLFPADYARLGLLALLAAALAALWPAWRLARMPPADLVKVFAHER